jgi:hypothetical protein
MLVGWMAMRAAWTEDDTAGGESVSWRAGEVEGGRLGLCKEKPGGIIHQGGAISTVIVEN